MNVLGICLSPGKGGLEHYARRSIHALAQAGHNCHFALRSDSDLYTYKWDVTLLCLKPRWRALPLLSAYRLAKYIDKHGIELLHMHWNKDLILMVLAKLLSRQKPSLIYSRHMEITRRKKDIYHRFLYRQVDLMLAVANFVQQQARRFLPLAEEQIRLLYLGVPAVHAASQQECIAMSAPVFQQQSAMTIGMVGRIEQYKGQHVLIEALAILARDRIFPKVALVGPVMDKDYFARLMRLVEDKGLSDNVIYLGESRQTQKLMSCCDVVVLTTYCETFGLVLVEAMRAGAAVIGTNAGGVPEIIHQGETGLLFEPGNAQDLADRLAAYLHDPPLRKRLAEAGKVYADTEFDEERHFSELIRILTQQVGERV